jgi:hypothetical protein
MTPRERVLKALRFERVDRVPFTMYESMIPQCATERELRNRGLCISHRNHGVFKTHRPNVKETWEHYQEDGKNFTRVVLSTPVGTLTAKSEPAGFTSWAHEKLFKTPDDFKAMLFILKDERFEPNYEPCVQAQADYGDDAVFVAGIGLEPLQALISGGLMKMEDFCVQWMDNRDELLKLYAAIVENHRKIYPLVAAGPIKYINYGGNVVPEVIGLENFEKYYVPHYNEAAEALHEGGKLIGCHFDANCRLLSKAIAATALDYIEAFTPSPTTDMTLGEAREAWPGKVLWLNFPSQLHLKADAEVERATVDLLDEVKSVDGIIMGITEDIPAHRWQGSCRAIMDGLDRHAREHPGLYS